MSRTPPPAPRDDAGEPEIVDVWSRTSSKYRVRAIVLLIVNVVLFAGLGCFAYWLRTGVNFAPSEEHYWRLFADTFMPRGEAHLGNFVLFPIRIDLVPMHGVVVGLLLAALVSIPILISILYRFPCSLPFILIVMFLAVMPWLAINLAGACILASVKPFRFRFRYASALLGLMLVLLYFYGASRQTTPLVENYAPVERIWFMAPWILATLASCVIMGGVLFLARVVNYRPGVVAPLLLICFAVPVILFEKHIGRDELYYRLLEQRFRNEFAERDGSEWFNRVTLEAWELQPPPKPSLEAFRRRVDLRFALEMDAALDMRSALAQQQEAFLDDCREFIRYFPDSRHAPNVLYLSGQALDARIDLEVFRQRKLLRYYFDFPLDSARSEVTWRKVVHNAPDSSASAVGRYKLAIFEAREGLLGQAVEWLDQVISAYDPRRPAVEPADAAGAVKKALQAAPPDASLEILVEAVVFDARRFLSLLLENGNDPLYGVRPFCGSQPGEPRTIGLLECDPRSPYFAANLRRLIDAYPRALLRDNLELMLAMQDEDLDSRIAALERVLQRFADGDALPEVLFRLGAGYLDVGSTARGRELLQRLVTEFPNNPFTPLAVNRLRDVPAVESEARS